MTTQAKVVIIGGGIVGTSAAYHLTKLGWKDIVLLDKGDLYHNDGSTSHAPGGVGAINHSKLMTDFAQYTSKLYASLPEFDQPRRTHTPVGGLELARSQERWEDMKRLHGAAQSYGVETELLTAKEVQKLWPIIDPDAFTGALYIPSSCLVSGAGAAGSMATEAVKTGSCTVHANTLVTDVEIKNNHVTAVMTDNPDLPRIECENILLCTNIWGPVLGDKLRVPLPLLAFEHQYTISEQMESLSQFDPNNRDHECVFPLIRDLDVTMYYRNHWNCLGVGSYWHKPKAVNPYDVGKSALRPFTEADFVDARKLANEMMPSFKEKKIETSYNGMFAFSVDGYPMMGETHIGGVWTCVASWITHAGGVGKSIAEWMVHGESEWDMRACNVNRFQDYQSTRSYIDQITKCNYSEVYDIVHPRRPTTVPRNVRLSPFHVRNVALKGELVPFAGIELPNWYEENARLLEKYEDQIPERDHWGAMHWSPIQAAEHLEVRANAGMFDLTGLSIIEIKGAGALTYVNWLCTNEMNRPIDSVIYTCWLTPTGGIKRDLTVARLADDIFWCFVGEGTLPQDLDWVKRNTPDDGSVMVTNISNFYAAIGLWGPNARKIMQKVTDDDLSNDGFPYYRAEWIEIGTVRVYALRISYVGELGWELHIPYDQSLQVWDALWEAGREYALIAAGSGCMDTLRVEKGYRLWGGDIYTEYNLYQAGLSWTAKLKKENGFIGRDATLRVKKEGYKKKLCCLTLDNPKATLFGYEPIHSNGTVIGHVTTSNYGYTVGKQLAFGYLPKEYANPGTELEISYFNLRYPATVVAEPILDKEQVRMKR
ncbi:FAD-dependent oxidoreductase [Chloroflexi bacterium TSY]|nr:FAD-dependent oxidoreductase [Chloroflexi bacterium TSY]